MVTGYALRLYPLTENFSKSLLEVQSKTILDWMIDIDTPGIVDKYMISSNHKFAYHFDKWKNKEKTTVVDDGTNSNETRLGAVRDIQFVIDRLGLDDMLVTAGDNLLDFSLTKYIIYPRIPPASCVILREASRNSRSALLSPLMKMTESPT